MTPEQSLVANALREWKLNVERAEALFSNLDEQQVRSEIAPGRNRLVYLWGHLIAVHDAMLPLLGLGARLHPELDAAFLTAADRTVGDLPTVAELGQLWREVHDRLLAGVSAFTAADWTEKHSAVSDKDFAVNPLRNRYAILLTRTGHLAYHLGQAKLAVTQ